MVLIFAKFRFFSKPNLMCFLSFNWLKNTFEEGEDESEIKEESVCGYGKGMTVVCTHRMFESFPISSFLPKYIFVFGAIDDRCMYIYMCPKASGSIRSFTVYAK